MNEGREPQTLTCTAPDQRAHAHWDLRPANAEVRGRISSHSPTSRMSSVMTSEVAQPSWLDASTQIS